ncbi:hypothetical protein PVOR_01550 [Paenibacillus vortex V453]|uniref:Uncharacterized protein n=1 Tax=Paenibacillus vortex V453 TaxID=715225 RepID=A0A2R9T2F4_9BACL|nr:hypothetical protein PVOR_01550 [Paenibacillus vortex V453]
MKIKQMQFVETLYMCKKQSQISDTILLWDISAGTQDYIFFFLEQEQEQEEKEQT